MQAKEKEQDPLGAINPFVDFDSQADNKITHVPNTMIYKQISTEKKIN